MINLYFGPPGNGKSAVAFMLGIDHLKAGGVLATNFKLVPDWAMQLAKMRLVCKLGFVDPVQQAVSYYNRCFLTGAPSSLYEISKQLNDLVLPKIKKRREGKGLLILDEAQLYLNSRRWEDNFPWIEFFTQHRKLGWNVSLIAHSGDMIDKQIRPLLEYETKLRNLKRVKLPFIPLHFPFDLFALVTKYAGMPEQHKSSVHSKRLIPLFLPVVRLYDTMEVFAFDSLPKGYSHQGNNPAFPSQSERKKISADEYFLSRRNLATRDLFV
ncbi:MAG: zonular occludens toxin domain-containing protein [Candidatus Electronema sp. V4]|uniref:zonular occludens toxin domain-containing protein n=1 Tax=Candidatus Electronema sp. V4 TaxID=3454756 RepID=UPI00405539CF